MAATADSDSFAYRFIEPPIDWGFPLDVNPSLPVRGLLRSETDDRARVPVVFNRLNHVLWAGCRDNQTSAEALIAGLYRGVFTCNLQSTEGRWSGKITRLRLDTQVTVNVRGMGYSQVQQLEGTKTSLSERIFT